MGELGKHGGFPWGQNGPLEKEDGHWLGREQRGWTDWGLGEGAMSREWKQEGWGGREPGVRGPGRESDGHDLGGRRQPSQARRESGAVSNGQIESFFPAERGVAGHHFVPDCARPGEALSHPWPEHRPGWTAGQRESPPAQTQN